MVFQKKIALLIFIILIGKETSPVIITASLQKNDNLKILCLGDHHITTQKDQTKLISSFIQDVINSGKKTCFIVETAKKYDQSNSDFLTTLKQVKDPHLLEKILTYINEDPETGNLTLEQCDIRRNNRVIESVMDLILKMNISLSPERFIEKPCPIINLERYFEYYRPIYPIPYSFNDFIKEIEKELANIETELKTFGTTIEKISNCRQELEVLKMFVTQIGAGAEIPIFQLFDISKGTPNFIADLWIPFEKIFMTTVNRFCDIGFALKLLQKAKTYENIVILAGSDHITRNEEIFKLLECQKKIYASTPENCTIASPIKPVEKAILSRCLNEWLIFPEQPEGSAGNQAAHISLSKNCNICQKECTSICSGCKSVYYCCAEHQKQDWPRHKPICKKYKL